MIGFITVAVVASLLLPSQCQQKFAYTSQQSITVEGGSSSYFSVSLTTQANQYLSQASIRTYLNIQQNNSNQYNLIYFNYQTQQGQQCYQNWVINNVLPPYEPCSYLSIPQEQLFYCMNYTQCVDENINFIIYLSEELFKQFFLIVQNPNSSSLVLNASVQMQLSSSNTWFYWGVGLTCLLLVALVIYAGIIFYWMLKYKKVKKMFEQFKLTEQQESIKKDN